MILIETNFNGVDQEFSESDKKMYLKGTFMEAENKNRNGRIYQKEEMQKEVDKINARMQNEDILGHLDHPQYLEIKLENVSHAIRELRMEGNTVVGKAEILDTPKGEIAKALLKSGIKVGVSSRGSGNVNENTGIVSDFNFVTVDLVASPSVQSAIPTTIWESLQMYKRGEVIENLAEAIKHDEKAQKYFKEEIDKFIKNLFK